MGSNFAYYQITKNLIKKSFSKCQGAGGSKAKSHQVVVLNYVIADFYHKHEHILIGQAQYLE